MSGSMALLVRTNMFSSSIAWFAGTVSTGGLLTSSTMIVRFLLALNGGDPSSVTFIFTKFVLGPWASVGAQRTKPSAELMVIPSGAETRLQVNVLAGRSESLAGLSITSKACSLILNSELVFRKTGAVFTSLTMTVKLLVWLKAGTPLSVTFTVIRFVLGP